MLKKILIGLGVLVLLLVIAVAVGPRFVDWNAYKPRVIEAVQKATGRQLSIDGNISLSLLPSPTLSVTDTFGPATGWPALMTAVSTEAGG